MSRARVRLISCLPLLFGAVVWVSAANANVLRLKTAVSSSSTSFSDEESGSAFSDAQSWLGPGGTLTEDAIHHLIEIIREDAQGAALVAQSIQKARETAHEPFWKVISVCPVGMSPNILGQTNRGERLTIFEGRDLEESTQNLLADGTTNTAHADAFYQSRIEQDRADDGISPDAPEQVKYFRDLVLIKLMTHYPGICLRANLSVDDAVSTLYHEMVHYIASDWSLWPKIGQYSGESDYELQQILRQGDEVDAYLSQWSYEIRKKGKSVLSPLLQPYFDDAGEFIPRDAQGADNRDAIAKLILGGKIFLGGEGYHGLRFVAEYANELRNEQNSQSILLNVLQQVATIDQKNLPYYQQTSSKLYEADQQSIARLPGEENSCKQRLDHINALIAQNVIP